VFDCAAAGLPFYLPGDGSMPLQFNHIRDLCRLIQRLLETKPQTRIYNTGDLQPVTIRQWVEMCYEAVGAPCRMISVGNEHPQRSYFPFYPYAYQLDVSRQQSLLPDLIPLTEGLRESWEWYRQHPQGVMKRDYAGYIAQHLAAP
ncbi:MAG: dTDP-glucose 4,6-dehydratase, partial [Clostridia bacterium]|nr:dTDP-glucose 4,6-dehydratase [Clostridia bacterium]